MQVCFVLRGYMGSRPERGPEIPEILKCVLKFLKFHCCPEILTCVLIFFQNVQVSSEFASQVRAYQLSVTIALLTCYLLIFFDRKQ